jgi:hypothetical protein
LKRWFKTGPVASGAHRESWQDGDANQMDTGAEEAANSLTEEERVYLETQKQHTAESWEVSDRSNLRLRLSCSLLSNFLPLLCSFC